MMTAKHFAAIGTCVAVTIDFDALAQDSSDRYLDLSITGGTVAFVRSRAEGLILKDIRLNDGRYGAYDVKDNEKYSTAV